ncbi:YdhR family protein [Streptomyces sp. SID13666]|uniref:YdhR family protein n=1 Tax=unclassified Streptomyces TaxID=2593676 RepID=UPI0013C14587|nr:MULTISPECIES: YdhR family protein [unclassified Streptomyces]NEA55078.1 YdhR family protein [Streptomyces sp. SID13666]NEA71085.1 YdhR family protein [Streptomyces sp. SID13588]
MKAMIAWWDLTESQQTAGTLRDFIREEEKRWTDISGLLLKVWLSDPSTGRWGAVLLWESEEAAKAAVLPRSPAELIGRPLDFRGWFDVEATVEGLHSLSSLAGLGPALAGPLAVGSEESEEWGQA